MFFDASFLVSKWLLFGAKNDAPPILCFAEIGRGILRHIQYSKKELSILCWLSRTVSLFSLCQRHFKMSIFAEMECRFLQGSIQVLYGLIHYVTCRLEACQALIYQLVSGLTGENGKYNYSKAVHLYPPFFNIFCSPKNYKIVSALTVVRMLLEAIYEPTFSRYSHGFRPKRSCHTALSEIKTTFSGVQWVIEGDIKACFDSFDHHVLIDILRRRIKDEHFIALMWKMLKAGYMEQWTYHHTYSGTPQGSGVSPILANIYLSELDRCLENYQELFKVGTRKRKASKEYERARQQYRAQKVLLDQPHTKEVVQAFKSAQQNLLQTPYYPQADPGYKSLQFNRYADDFVVGIIGSRKDAEQVKTNIRDFLANTLKLTLSEEKTKITHSSELIYYLGYQFTVRRSKDVKRNSDGVLRRMWYGTVALYVPHDKWVQKLKEYQAFKIVAGNDGRERWKPLHRGKLMHKDALAIISQFNAEIRGLYNYYSIAENVSVLNNFAFIMKGSFLKTLAAKGNTSCNKIRKKYEQNGVFSIPYVTKSGPKRCEFYHDGFTKQSTLPALSADTLPQYVKYDKPNSLAKRLKAGVCELCGVETKEIHMHHVRRLKDLKGRNELELKMMQMRRKSIALCPECYAKTKHAD